MVTTLREPATSITLAVENPMSVARELFLDVGHPRLSAGDEAYEKLSRAAELWRKDGQHFSAGLAMLDACDAAWGQPDRMLEALEKGLTDFERAVAEEPPSSPVSIAALYKLRQSVNRTSWFDDDRSTASTSVRELSSELGQRLLKHFKDLSTPTAISSEVSSSLLTETACGTPDFPTTKSHRVLSIPEGRSSS